jgi:hypothetical protein
MSGIMDRERLAPHQRARLQEEEQARNATGPLFKNGRATHPDHVRDARDLPQTYYAFFERELVARLSDLVSYDDTRKYALQLTLKHWRKNLARNADRREKRDAAKGNGGLFQEIK